MHTISKFTHIAALVCGGLLLAATPARAQTYPAKPVRVVVPFPAGGIVDILARAVTEKNRHELGFADHH